jgi:hypothetical protein
MRKERRWWLLGPVLIGLVFLLGRTWHAAPGGSIPSPAPTEAVDAARADDGVGPAHLESRETSPRHPEIGFRSPDLLVRHFRKHGAEFSVRTPDDYLRLAQALRDRPKGGDVLELVRNDAVTCKFDQAEGAFVAYNSDGTIRTFFRPRDGQAYFERQRSRNGEAP